MSRGKNNESSLSKLLVGAAVGAGVGLAAFMGKTLYDTFQEEQKEKEECCGGGGSGASGGARGFQGNYREESDDEDDYNSPMDTTNGTAQEPLAAPIPEEPLHVQLSHYYKSYASVPVNDMSKAKQVVENAKALFMKYCRKNIQDIQINELVSVGSVDEGLKAIKADEFDEMIVLKLDKAHWNIDDPSEIGLQAPGFWLLANNTSHPDSEFLNYPARKLRNDAFLSPASIRMLFQASLANMVEAYSSHREYVFRATIQKHAITLHVEYFDTGERKNLAINFTPAVMLDSTTLTTRPHDNAVKHTDPGYLHVVKGGDAYKNLWCQSFAAEEKACLGKLPPLPETCHKQCLIIMKAIRLNHLSQLGPLSSYAFKTLLLHLLDKEDDWAAEALPERFFDMLLDLKEALNEGQLFHYHCAQLNLLAGMKKETMDNIRFFILKMMNPDKISQLLKTEY